MVLLILAIVWAIFLVPQLLRARATSRPIDSIGAFQEQLSVLARTAPAGPGPARRGPDGRRILTRREVRKRRRDILAGLLVAMAVSLVLAAIPPLRSMLVVHLALDVVFAGYVALLLHARRAVLAAESGATVRFLPDAPAPATVPEPALLIRQPAN